MSSPAPLLRPPIPGSRQNGGSRTPRLGLSIPSPVGAKTMKNGPKMQGLSLQMPGQISKPTLRLGDIDKNNQASYGQQIYRNHGHSSINTSIQSSSYENESQDTRSRSDSIRMANGKAGIPDSAGSQYSALTFAQYGLRQTQESPNPPPVSVSTLYSERSDNGVRMERSDSIGRLESFGRLSLERGRTLDVEELDDEGWRIASMENRIQELSSLGEGAGGAVTKCVLKGGKTIFALKIITTNPDPDVKKQIVRELGFNKDCANEHICRYYGAFVETSTATISIAMEFCEGGSLDSIYREVKKLGGRTGEKVLGKIAEGVLNGLTYLHGKKIIHRDIKPSNILLCRDGQVKLCDFGVSGEFGTKGDANTFIGTSYYMAPERITGQSYTITSDVWSTGVTLLEVAQHRFPFPADGTDVQPRAGLIDLLTYIVRQPVPKLKDEPEAGIKWSENFKYFIECCLEKVPSRRATPWRMLEHPWMTEMRSKRVHMAHFLATVWGWDEKK
ncbi:MAP kinase kinase MKK1/SSP32 [Erysiphe necator]|uniref:Putative map kinase kinase n=1 Tax=Uncinula necator TaxID=52586 RepID=A0A0B1NX49_UNCNE|nr:MAP kinase kinase MKK1/SSP32 [Erysiphe necator]KHJ30553.1 putative map kinase kinase [Erysiphe necator]